MATTCPVSNVLAQDPRFEALKEAYVSKHFSDDYLAEALQLYREYLAASRGTEIDNKYFPVTPNERGAFTRFIHNQLAIERLKKTTSTQEEKSVYDLYTELYSLYPPEVLGWRLDYLSTLFRRRVNYLQNNDTKHRSRAEIIKAQRSAAGDGFTAIMHQVFKFIEKKSTAEAILQDYKNAHPGITEEELEQFRPKAEYRAAEFKKMLEHRDALAALASVRIGEEEGFAVSIRGNRVDFQSYEEALSALEAGAKEEGENQEVDSEEATKGDRYIDYRTVKLMETLSPRVKRLLSQIFKVDQEGNKMTDDIGNVLTLSPRQAAIVLQRVLTNSTPDSFVDDILTAANQYPWLRGLYDKLQSDKSLRKTIYAGLKTQETNYVYVSIEDGHYKLSLANTKSRSRAAEAEAANNLQYGTTPNSEYSIVTGYGKLRTQEELGKVREAFNAVRDRLIAMTECINLVGGTSPTRAYINQAAEDIKKKYGIDTSYLLEKDPQLAMKKLFEANPDDVKTLAKLLQGLGFDITAENIITMATQPLDEKNFKYLGGNSDSRYSRNKLALLLNNMQDIYKGTERYSEKKQKEQLSLTGRFLYTQNAESFRKITGCLALALYDERQDRTLQDGKVLNTHNPVNLLHQIIDRLANKDGRDEQTYQDNLRDEFLQYEGMALSKMVKQKDGTRVRVEAATGWLKWLQEHPESREKIQVYDNVGNNHVEYAKMSPEQKQISTLVSYFAGQDTLLSGDFRLIEFPIQADYGTAYNFIASPHYDMSQIIQNLVDEVLIEAQRISAIQRRTAEKIIDENGEEVDNPDYDPNRAVLKVYEENGIKFQIFPAMNDTGLLDQIRTAPKEQVRNIVRDAVVAELEKVMQKDFKILKDSGVLSNSLFYSIGRYDKVALYQEDGDPNKLSAESQGALRDCFANIFYARQQMVKLVAGGPEHFDGLIDAEKRFMMFHAPHSALDTNAYWGDELVGKKEQTVAYIEDDNAKSVFFKQITKMLKDLHKEGFINERQYNTMSAAFKKIKDTDGQGLRSFDSYREVMIMADMWTQRHEDAYGRIKEGHPLKDDVDLFMAEIKPVYTGHEHIAASTGKNQKPVRLPVLHKYSETVLLPLALAEYCLKAKVVPYQGIEDAREQLAEQGKPIDLFLFHSCVKVGYHSGMRPFAKWKDLTEEQKKKAGWKGQGDDERILTTADGIRDYIISAVHSSPFTIHTLPFSNYGIAASMPVNVEDEHNHIVSQAEKQLWANLLPGDEVTFRGKKMKAEDARRMYYEIKTAEIVEQYKALRKIFGSGDKLEELLNSELLTKSYNSGEMKYALAHLKDGTFALPLFSPNIEHQVQQLIASVIKKRLSKPNQKGANLIQVTSLGMDMEISPFDNNNALSEKEKLGVVFDDDENPDSIKYVEVAMPIHDKRLKRYADEKGNISAERLEQLVKEGKIDERMLYFMAYRTPSDAEHSIIPCKIKYFVSAVGGAGIRMPKEVMVLTGHDYDGDKMHCHFAEFTEEWDEKMIRKRYEEYSRNEDDKALRYILGLSDADSDPLANEKLTYEEYYNKFIKAKQIPNREQYRKLAYIEYDEAAKPLGNSTKARNNAKLELMFAKATSPRGSHMMLIPGGCEETKIIAKARQITKLAKDPAMQSAIAAALVKTGMSTTDAEAIVPNTSKLFYHLISRNEPELADILKSVNGNESMFSYAHSIEAFDYIMGGASMIEVYALFSSAFQMFQRLNLRYKPYVTKGGNKPVPVVLFGHTLDKICDVRTMSSYENGKEKKGVLRSLTTSHCVNAAVDNGKDPILGYLNQNKNLADFSMFLDAAGLSELEMHLFMNQPVMVELSRRVGSREGEGFRKEALKMLDELTKRNPVLAKFASHKIDGQIAGVYHVAKLKEEDFAKYLVTDYSELADSQDLDLLRMSAALLQAALHLQPVANQLSSFVRRTRPESDSGSLGHSVPQLLARLSELEDFRAELAEYDEKPWLQRIDGMNSIVEKRDMHEGWEPNYIMEHLDSELPEVTTQNTLMLDDSVDLFAKYFPLARKSWRDVAMRIARAYKYRTVQEGVLRRVWREMLLWRMMSNKKFVQGDVSEEQKRIIVDVPAYLRRLLIRINSAEDSPELNKLKENLFLRQFTVSELKESSDIPRLMFYGNSMEAEGTADTMRSFWNDLLQSDLELQKGDEAKYTVHDLAIDLFLYNLYTNGFNYGRYEFAHFAPYSVLVETPEYIEAMQKMTKTDWKDQRDIENFIHQYYMNHWGDGKLVPQLNQKYSGLKFIKSQVDGQVWISKDTDEEVLNSVAPELYVVLYDYVDNPRGGNKKIKKEILYRVLQPDEAAINAGAQLVLEEAEKFGVRNFHKQVTLQYNPAKNYKEMKPVIAGNDSAWGQQDELNFYGEANYEDSGMTRMAPRNPVTAQSFDFDAALSDYYSGGQKAQKQEQIRKLDEKANIADPKNDEALSKQGVKEAPVETNPSQAPAPTEKDAPPKIGEAFINQTFSDIFSGKAHLARVDENGRIVEDVVPASPYNISEARKQRIFVRLNKTLRKILRDFNISTGALTAAEARMGLTGISDFDTAIVTAEGMKEMIRLLDGIRGEYALPEEFGHVMIEMIGHDHPLVQRLLNVLRTNREAMQEAYDGMYDRYEELYGNDMENLVLEAAGKLLAKALFKEQVIKSSPVRTLIHRIIDWFKGKFRGTNAADRIEDAIFEAEGISSQLAREILGGKLLHEISTSNIKFHGKLMQAANDISDKEDIVHKLFKQALKRRNILRTRLAYMKNRQHTQAYSDTEDLIADMERNIKNAKSEEVVISYCKNSLSYISQTKQSFDKVLNGKSSGFQKMNSIGKKLSTFRDVLNGDLQVLDMIDKAIASGEIQDTVDLKTIRHELANIVSDMLAYTDKIGFDLGVETMGYPWGKEGVVIPYGKDKGKKITPEDMMTRAEHDISIFSRWFGALSDANDYVLQGIDYWVKNAKREARRKLDVANRRVVAAIAKLEKETGSRDMSFVKEKKRYDGKAWCNGAKDDGKLHSTGKFIVKDGKEYKALSQAQRDFYDEMRSIMKELNKCVPEMLLEEDAIPMVRKSAIEKFLSSESVREKGTAVWDILKDRYLDTSDDTNYDGDPVAVDFTGNSVDRLPLKFLHKGKNEQYDDMTDDIATAMVAYAGMALEYHEMNKIIGIIENVKYMASKRDVVQRTGWRKKREYIGNPEKDDTVYSKDFTVKQAKSFLQDMLNDYFKMHVYEHLAAEEGTIGKTKISKRKVADRLRNLTSLSQMAFNLTQRITNLSTGNVQILLDAVGGDKFGIKDVAWATGIYLKNAADRMMDTGKDESDNYLSLFLEKFDIHQNNRRNGVKFAKGKLSRMVNTNLLYAGLRLGEDALAAVTALAIAHAHKVKVEGKEEADNLFNAYEKKYTDPVNKTGAYLELKKGYTEPDMSAINKEVEDIYENLVVRTNFDNQGIYNTDDKNAAEQYILGSLTMMYRKWIYPAMKRRYALAHPDLMAGGNKHAEGFHITMGRFLLDALSDTKDEISEKESALAMFNLYEDIKAFVNALHLNWDKLDDYEKANIRKSLTEIGSFIGLWMGIALLSNIHDRDDDDELTWWDNQVMVQLLRLRTEIGSQAPSPMFVNEVGKIVRTPFASLGTIQDALNGFRLLIPSNYFAEIKSGRYKGHTKAYKYFRELPIISILKKWDNFADPSPLINYYKNDAVF